ncbi:MAG: SDR family NAD(P)-dependent oxidoreductase [Pseudomonadota bacterium]
MDIKGKTAFITGGAGGLGLAMARAFGARGANIMLADIDEKAAKAVAADLASAGIEAAGCALDVRDAAAFDVAAKATVERFGAVHMVVNNAGVSLSGMTGEFALEDWRWIVDINLMGVVYGTECFTRLFKAQDEGGYILNVASMAGHGAFAGGGPYHATKFAVVGYSESLRHEFKKSNIGVSVLCPGFVQTGIGDSVLGAPSGTISKDDPTVQFAQHAVDTGLEPGPVAEWVAKCVEDGRFYIFTHAEMRDGIDVRRDRLAYDYDAALAHFATVADG